MIKIAIMSIVSNSEQLEAHFFFKLNSLVFLQAMKLDGLLKISYERFEK